MNSIGYSYFGARYYNPNISIWLSVDPLSADYPSYSPYNYTLNNPVKFIDPDGTKIEVSRIDRTDRPPLIMIRFTADLINISSMDLSNEQLQDVSDQISSQIIESYSGIFDGAEVSVTTDKNVLGTYSSQKEADDLVGLPSGHTIMIANPDDSDFNPGDVGATTRVSKDYGDIKISNAIVNDRTQLKRTGSHEFGHAAGLSHPMDTGDEEANNLMYQSDVSDGTRITPCQIEKIEIENR